MPGMSHLLLAIQPASAAGHRTCLPEVPAEADLVRNYQGTVLRPALSRRESAGVLIGVAGEQLLVLGRQPVRLRLPGTGLARFSGVMPRACS